MIKTTTALCMVLSLGAAACSGKTDAPAAAGPGADAACTDYAKARCDKFAACEVLAVPFRYGDSATCLVREKLGCMNSLAASPTGATPDSVEACLAVYATFSCADYMNNNPPAVCQSQKGALANGSACAFNAQCQSSFCAMSKGTACGTCEDAPKAGDSCASVTNCGYNLVCSKVTQTCTASGAVGAACTKGDNTCGYGLGCAGTTAAAPDGTCQPSAKAGEGCGFKEGAVCDTTAGLYCNAGLCEAATEPKTGEACGKLSPDGGFGYCVGAASCDSPDAGAAGTCEGPAADGQPCDTVEGKVGCMAPARCVGTVSEAGVVGTCRVPTASACAVP
jgi:hypothetical protein